VIKRIPVLQHVFCGFENVHVGLVGF
jgi:hypothetical protein